MATLPPASPAARLDPDFPYAGYARSLGLDGPRAEDPKEIRATWQRAVSADRPFVFEAVTDPEVPPLPPHIRFEQAKELASAILHRDPATPQIVKQAVKGKVQEFVNR